MADIRTEKVGGRGRTVIVNRDIQIADGNDAVIQEICHLLNTNEGEIKYDLTYGFPWFEILSTIVDAQSLSPFLIRELLAIDGVSHFSKFPTFTPKPGVRGVMLEATVVVGDQPFDLDEEFF